MCSLRAWTLRGCCFCHRVQCTAIALSTVCARMCQRSKRMECKHKQKKIVRRSGLRFMKRTSGRIFSLRCSSSRAVFRLFFVCMCVENISFQSRCVIVSSGKAFVALASKDRNKEAETHCWCYQSCLSEIIQLSFFCVGLSVFETCPEPRWLIWR